MDPRDSGRTGERGTPDGPAREGRSTQLDDSQIVPSAPAKEEKERRRIEEQEAEGGHLGTGPGIGADKP
jgi:hypothetical protein